MVAVDLEENEERERDRDRVKVNDEPDEPDMAIETRGVEFDDDESDLVDALPIEALLFSSLSLARPPTVPAFFGSLAFFGLDFFASRTAVAVSSAARSPNKDGPSGSLSLDRVTGGGGGGEVEASAERGRAFWAEGGEVGGADSGTRVGGGDEERGMVFVDRCGRPLTLLAGVVVDLGVVGVLEIESDLGFLPVHLSLDLVVVFLGCSTTASR